MTVLPDLERALVQAAGKRCRRRRPPAVALVAAALLVAGLTAAAISGERMSFRGESATDEPASKPRSPHTGHPATCAKGSSGATSADFPGAFTSPDNLVVGPFAMIGAGRYTPSATVREFGGNKFPVLLQAGHTVTVALSRRANRSASLFYAIGSGGALTETRVGDGRRAITFRACRARKGSSGTDRTTFWSGFVVVARPMCVRLKLWIDALPEPRRSQIALGRRC